MSTVIRGGTVVTAAQSYAADVLIDGERIAGVGPNLQGDKVVDAAGCYVMPGGIDPHTHLEMPFMGTTTADDYDTGTKAALAGGTTMVVDFCIPNHGQKLLDAWADWDRRSATARTDYAYHMCIISWSDAIREEMAAVVAKGVTTFKHFMAYKGALMVDDEELFASFKRCAELGAMPLVHAENGDVVAALQAELLASGITGPRATPIPALRRSKARLPTGPSCWPTRPVCRSTSSIRRRSRPTRPSGAPARSAGGSMASP